MVVELRKKREGENPAGAGVEVKDQKGDLEFGRNLVDSFACSPILARKRKEDITPVARVGIMEEWSERRSKP